MHGLRRGISHKEQQKPSAADNVEEDERNRDDPDHFQACLETGVNTVELFGTVVLSGIIGHSVSNRRERSDHQVVQFDTGRIACHDSRSEAVDGALYDDISDGNEALLQSAGNCHLQEFSADAAGEKRCFFISPDRPESSEDEEHRERAACALADEGGPGNACDSHVESRDEPDVHGDIGAG